MQFFNTLTCQGHAPLGLSLPLMMRPCSSDDKFRGCLRLKAPLTPHSGKRKKESMIITYNFRWWLPTFL